MRTRYVLTVCGAALFGLVGSWGCIASKADNGGTVGGPPERSGAAVGPGAEREGERTGRDPHEGFGRYTYWVQLTSLGQLETGDARQRDQPAPFPVRSGRVYIPFFAIDGGKYSLPLKAWEKGPGGTTLSLPDTAHADRDLTVEDTPIDLVRGFGDPGEARPESAEKTFRHSVYWRASGGGVFTAEFEIAREPNPYPSEMEADLALFDRGLVDVYFRDTAGARGGLSCVAALGRRAAATLFDVVFIVDRLFAKPRSVTSPDYVARISQPSSRFHADYLEYQRGVLREDELVQRLPHVAMIGDSLTKNAYVSSIPSSLWRIRTAHQQNWFLDAEKPPEGISSVYARLEELTPLVAVEYTGVGAFVDSGGQDQTFTQMLIHTRNFSQQVDQILAHGRFPDLVLIWIGHNNLNWAAPLNAEQRRDPDKYLLRQLWLFRKNYARQLRRLVERAKAEQQRTAIMVYGLVNFEAFFQARDSAESLRAEDPALYPYFERDYEIYVSMRPEYRQNMIRLALLMNAELRHLVEGLQGELSDLPHVRVQYSDALASVDIRAVELIHAVDAWHPSRKGHNRLAEAAFGALAGPLRFLGISPP